MAVALLLFVGATADTGCESTCSVQSNACYSRCVGANRCTTRCGERTTDCISACNADRTRRKNAKRDKKGTPCEASATGAARPCSEKERTAMKKALSSPQTKGLLCKDAAGNLNACPEDLKLAQAQYDKHVAKCTPGSKAPECSTE